MYVDGMENKVMEGYRLSVIRWKTPTAELKNPAYKKTPTLCVPLPALPVSVMPVALQVAMQEAVDDIQDAAVRSFISQEIENKPGINLVSIMVPEKLGTHEGIAEFAAAKAASGRLSKESLGAWFDAILADSLVDAIIARLPPDTEDAASVAVAQIAGARTAVVGLASPRANIPQRVAVQLLKAVCMAPKGDKTRAALEVKLGLFANPPSAEELLLSL
jgi:hypothetical protein